MLAVQVARWSCQHVSGRSFRSMMEVGHTKRAFCRQVATSSGSREEIVGWEAALSVQVRGVWVSAMLVGCSIRIVSQSEMFWSSLQVITLRDAAC